MFESVINASAETLNHVAKLPMVLEFNTRIESSKLAPLFHPMLYGREFDHAPAAASKHHNFTHGLLLHTAEVWKTADMLYGELPDGARITHDSEFPFTRDELFVAVALHDFAKIRQYAPSSNNCWKRAQMLCNQEVWTLNECAKQGISLTDNELVGLLHAEGGYTEFEVDWRPMSVVVHAADLWSSQAMRFMWDPAKEASVLCPKCKQPMALRSGKMGDFYGCTGYPACNGIVNMRDAPDVAGVFLDFLRKNYPLPV